MLNFKIIIKVTNKVLIAFFTRGDSVRYLYFLNIYILLKKKDFYGGKIYFL